MRRLIKRPITMLSMTIVFWALAFTVHAGSSGLLVLVDPESAEAALIEELGYLPIDSMQALQAQYDPNSCVIGIGRSGYAIADWEWIIDKLDQSTALVGLGWDIGELMSPGHEPPPSIPGLISVLYLAMDEPVTYTMDSTEELDDFMEWACFMVGDADAWPDSAFDFDPMDLDLLLSEILSEAQPLLAFMNQFLQAEWEYKVVSLESTSFEADTAFEKNLNVLGKDGWELVLTDGPRLVFKRRALSAERLMEIILDLTQEMMESFSEPETWFF